MDDILRPENYPDLAEFKKAVDDAKSCVVFSSTEYAKYHMTAMLGRPFLFIAPDMTEARRAARALSEFTGREVVYIPEREDPLKPVAPVSNATKKERIAALGALLDGRAFGAVTTVEGALQYLPPKTEYAELFQTVKTGRDYDRDGLCEKLVAAGYRREDTAEREGVFTARGDRIEVWSYDAPAPVRIEFFGDEVESIKEFAPDTKLSYKTLDSITLSPAIDFLVPRNKEENTLKRVLSKQRLAKKRMAEVLQSMVDAITLGSNTGALYYIAPLISGGLSTVFDYISGRAVVVYSDVKACDDRLRLFLNNYYGRVKSFTDAGEAYSEQRASLLNREELYQRATGFVKVGFGLITSSCPAFLPEAVFSIKSLAVPRYTLNRAMLFADLKNYAVNGATVAIYAGSAFTAERLSKDLMEEGLAVPVKDAPEHGALTIVSAELSHGFIYPKEKLVVIGTGDVVRKTEVRDKPSRKKRENFIVPKVGEYVVHERYGIGISEGIKSVETSSGVKDFFIILYKDQDRLYVPTDQMDLVDRWSGSGTPTIYRLGGREFERLKERVKESAKKMAIDLLKLYERRERATGFKYSPDTPFQKELEDSFEFEETSDQLSAIADIKEDMESGRVMDRLLAGDVGYGKTEVAIRAMFKTVWDGKQAALLAPTTILAQQHYNNISARLNRFGIKTVLLSRFQTDAEIKEAVEKIASGEAQITVATHRLLSKDIAFKDLGLLVLDEEQRFGVEHKEKLKTMKTNVNVLTMSATPIPRTLHMALVGIRDISVLAEPPKNRLPVETYVTEYSDSLAVDAIKREVSRDGQVFVLFNDTKRIVGYYRHLQSLLPDVPMIYAHGQMESGDLENRIRLFYEKEARVMISTTIIENGIDIPDANTLIVLHSDKLGLSALYQLKGRVGRSGTLAYAYFTVPENKVVSGNAEKRLSALLECTELGSGFKLAERDLEIRGAGNVLGREQHGNMEKVGYDLYMRLVKESVAEARGETALSAREVDLNIDGDCTVPKEYIADADGRITALKRAAELSGKEERLEYLKELTDVYGAVPESVMNLVDKGVIKNLAKKLGIKTVTIGRQTSVEFYGSDILGNASLMDAISENAKKLTLSFDKIPYIIFRLGDRSQRERIRFIRGFLERAAG